MRSRISARCVQLSLLAGAVLASGVPYAQDNATDEITVTGTRIRRDDYTSTTATQTVNREDMERLGLVGAADMLAQLPSNVATFTLDTTGESDYFVGATIANLRGANTAFGTRTLTLVDGQRFVTTTNGGGVDLSFIPSILIGRMETVTGGASAVYGSDATAGVVNIILDRNVQGLRLDASYGQNTNGDFKNYSVSAASGLTVLKGKGSLTLSYEHQDTDPVGSCADALDWCARSMGRIQTYRTTTSQLGCNATNIFAANACQLFAPIPEAAQVFPGANLPAFAIFEGQRYLHRGNPYGVVRTLDPLLPTACTAAAMNNCRRVGDATLGNFYQFTPDGSGLVEWQSRELIPDARETGNPEDIWRQFAYSNSTNIYAGEGQVTSADNQMRNGQTRNNMFLRFNWDATDDIRVNAQLSYGITEGVSIQNRVRTNENQDDNLCIWIPEQGANNTIVASTFTSPAIVENSGSNPISGPPRYFGGPNAFFNTVHNPMTPEAVAILLDRGRNNADTANVLCTPPGNNRPYGTTTGLNFGPPLGLIIDNNNVNFDLRRPGIQIDKSWRGQFNSGVNTETDVTRISVGADGPLFGFEKWTWNGNLQFGSSDREQELYNNRTGDRWRMAIDSTIDETTGDAVCRVNESGVVGRNTQIAWMSYFLQEPYYRIDLNSERAIEAQARIDALRAGCVPLNPFGLGYNAAVPGSFERQQAAIAYAWDDLRELSYSDQTVASFSVSGEFWKGFGAGPLTMAAGIDYRDESTLNENAGSAANRFVRTDFFRQYGDPWAGATNATEAFAEFELPLVRDRIGAQSLSTNITYRRTRNYTDRETFFQTAEEALENPDPPSQTRFGESWRSSLVWRPMDWATVRVTRSADIRSPTPRELFYRQTRNTNTTLTANPWRPFTQDAGYFNDEWLDVPGANPNLKNESSTTQTFGLVFQPGGWASGLSLSMDYNEIVVQRGITGGGSGVGSIGADEENDDCFAGFTADQPCHYTIYRCYQYNDPFYCAQITFDPPEPEAIARDPNGIMDPALCQPEEPCLARSNIGAIVTTSENAEPYWTRGVDYSASYNFRLGGGGQLAARLLATRALEQNRCDPQSLTRDVQGNSYCGSRINVVGITGAGGGNPGSQQGFTSQPKWQGNVYVSYSKNAFAITTQGRYVGKGVISLNLFGPEDPRWCAPCLNTEEINALPSWLTWNLTTSYNFARSRFAPERFENLQLSLTVDNLFDKQPNFYSGGGTGGVNTRFFNGNGRTYRLNFRSAF